LEIANRELEAFSYSVSHDLRAPLRHISSFSTILSSEHAGELNGEAQHLLGRIIAGCEKMGKLIDDILELSYVSRHGLKNENVNLTRIARRIATSLREHAPERNVRFEIAEDLTATGDERLLEIVLNNLLNNAWKYTSRKDEGVIEFGSQKLAARPAFFVKDNGAGFDKSYADKLFMPFSRLHGQEFEGTGIGLAIVQRVIHRHGGKIWADSVEGEGATFYFTLK
ncbi:MAG TPA: ATP-binding protein, partial [Geobacteraceae bacterium]|nr:ATP-binding protein [Geobacteraceae bacterium]